MDGTPEAVREMITAVTKRTRRPRRRGALSKSGSHASSIFTAIKFKVPRSTSAGYLQTVLNPKVDDCADDWTKSSTRMTLTDGAISAILCGSMPDTADFSKTPTRALLVGTYVEASSKVEAQSLLEELAELVRTLGVPVGESMLVHHREPHPRYLIGSGKAAEIVAHAKEAGLDLIIFDHELSPSQQRNWEKLAELPVIDRQEVILDIFAQRAQTREARLQIELARTQYSLPRLTRAWGHLARQGGGIGARGEGESQLEQDKRRLRGQIEKLKAELKTVLAARATQRKDRQRTPVPNAAIVGYTNAGKSSLLRRLTGADVFIEDKLFATLDTTTRRIDLPNKQPLLLTDTVGFVRKLPHRLIEAFNATLEESVLADFLIHVLDASQPEVIEFYNTTRRVLSELSPQEKPVLLVFNKIDKVEDPAVLANLRRHFPEAHFISIHTGAGMDELIARIGEWVANGATTRELRLPVDSGALLARLHREARVHEIEYLGEEIRLVATLPRKLCVSLAEFIVVPADEKPIAIRHANGEKTAEIC
jgi:GTP-binding protein HflX